MYGKISSDRIEINSRGSYPLLDINPGIICQNSKILLDACRKHGVDPAVVIKGFNALPSITKAVVQAGCHKLASSRLEHLKQVKEAGYLVETMALRVAMLSEIKDLVRYADISLESEQITLEMENEEAKRQGRVHKVILMRDLGDLREGCIKPEQLYQLAEYVEKKLPFLHLHGIGTNLTCYGSIIPTVENLTELTHNAQEIERRIGRKLNVVSGGSTSSLPLLFRNQLPAGINELRIGEAMIVPCDLLGYWDTPVTGMSNHSLILKAEIIELGEKPTKPIGKQGINGFGTELHYEDRGVRRRALLALGVFDIGDCEKIIPLDEKITVLGGSSDHLIIDIHDSKRAYCLGDIVEFELHYKSMLFATASPMIRKVVDEG